MSDEEEIVVSGEENGDEEEEEERIVSGEENGDDDIDDEPQIEISGWADAMSKILGSTKPQKKKQLILSRAKKDYEVRKPVVQVPTIEVVETEQGTSSEIQVTDNDTETNNAKKVKKAAKKAKKRKSTADANDEDDDGDEIKDHLSLKKQHRLELKHKRMQKQWENLNRSKPNSAQDREGERELMKIATKGVVELFNAVNLQKKTLIKKLQPVRKSEFKRDKVLAETKDLFEDALEKVTKKRIK